MPVDKTTPVNDQSLPTVQEVFPEPLDWKSLILIWKKKFSHVFQRGRKCETLQLTPIMYQLIFNGNSKYRRALELFTQNRF